MYLVKIFKYNTGNELLISADNFEVLSRAVNIYRHGRESEFFNLAPLDHVYIMDGGTGKTIDHILIKEDKAD